MAKKPQTTIRDVARKAKSVAPLLAASTLSARDEALGRIADGLRAHVNEIAAANQKDLQAAEKAKVAAPIQKRLRYDQAKMDESLAQLSQLQSLPDPIGRVLLRRELDKDLVLTRVSCPIGVIGVIFEARPDALVQVASLCIKSGNCAILKGGSETAHTNRVLFDIVHEAVVAAGLPEECLALAESHAEIDELLACDGDVDLLIPRGSNAFVRHIMDNTKIPVMGHAAGICHVYVDRDADQDMAVRVVVDAKTQYPAVCNAAETLLVDRAIATEFLPRVREALASKGARLRGTREVAEDVMGAPVAPEFAVEVMNDDEWGTEYGDLVMSCKVVSGVEEAVDHINRWGSHHTDSIITANDETAAYFQRMVDSAGVYRNCSTRFADGYRYGFGAEVGISTGKLHARGPVGLEGLETYKYLLEGTGQIVDDYASGRSHFHFRDL